MICCSAVTEGMFVVLSGVQQSCIKLFHIHHLNLHMCFCPKCGLASKVNPKGDVIVGSVCSF